MMQLPEKSSSSFVDTLKLWIALILSKDPKKMHDIVMHARKWVQNNLK